MSYKPNQNIKMPTKRYIQQNQSSFAFRMSQKTAKVLVVNLLKKGTIGLVLLAGIFNKDNYKIHTLFRLAEKSFSISLSIS